LDNWQKLGDVTARITDRFDLKTEKLAERLHSKIEMDSEADCWIWTAGKFPNGYGNIWHNGTNRGAHCVSYELYRGPIPAGMYVCHHCDNPACVNPHHLFLGTPADNMADRDTKGRQARGPAHGLAKLTEADIQAIRNAGNISNMELAQQYGVHNATISCIRLGKTWAHVEQPFRIELNGPLAEALCQYAEQMGVEPSTIIAEAVRAYMGDSA
jgi:hypothetical protein